MHASRDSVKIGVVVHGPEVIDSGKATEWLDYLHSLGEVRAHIGGVMGAVAVIDAGMEGRIETGRRELVSETVRSMLRDSDSLFLLNLGKTRESGLAFGAKVLGKLTPHDIPVVQIDDGFVVAWGDGSAEMARKVADDLGMELVERTWPRPLPRDRRVLDGVRPGESIWIDGVVVGKATGDRVVITKKGSGLRFEGIDVKPSGLERLGEVDLAKALIRSGTVRRTTGSPRRRQRRQGGVAVLIDHCAEDAFHLVAENQEISLAVTVGDDTTRVTGYMLFRLGVPIIGLTDGDMDGICREELLADGSVILRLRPGSDDVVGREVLEKVFDGKGEIRFSDRDTLIDHVVRVAADRLTGIRRIDA